MVRKAVLIFLFLSGILVPFSQLLGDEGALSRVCGKCGHRLESGTFETREIKKTEYRHINLCRECSAARGGKAGPGPTMVKKGAVKANVQDKKSIDIFILLHYLLSKRR